MIEATVTTATDQIRTIPYFEQRIKQVDTEISNALNISELFARFSFELKVSNYDLTLRREELRKNPLYITNWNTIRCESSYEYFNESIEKLLSIEIKLKEIKAQLSQVEDLSKEAALIFPFTEGSDWTMIQYEEAAPEALGAMIEKSKEDNPDPASSEVTDLEAPSDQKKNDIFDKWKKITDDLCEQKTCLLCLYKVIKEIISLFKTNLYIHKCQIVNEIEIPTIARAAIEKPLFFKRFPAEGAELTDAEDLTSLDIMEVSKPRLYDDALCNSLSEDAIQKYTVISDIYADNLDTIRSLELYCTDIEIRSKDRSYKFIIDDAMLNFQKQCSESLIEFQELPVKCRALIVEVDDNIKFLNGVKEQLEVSDQTQEDKIEEIDSCIKELTEVYRSTKPYLNLILNYILSFEKKLTQLKALTSSQKLRPNPAKRDSAEASTFALTVKKAGRIMSSMFRRK